MQELAIASVPMQEYRELYAPDKALARGTLFMELDLPWEPEKGKRGGCRCGARKERAE